MMGIIMALNILDAILVQNSFLSQVTTPFAIVQYILLEGKQKTSWVDIKM